MPVVAPEMVLGLQTVFLTMLFVSFAFRMKRNYLAHAIVLIVSAAIVLSGFSAVFILAFLNGESILALSNPLLFGIHGFFGALALGSGIFLVALWRPRSVDFATRSKRVWQVTMVSWVAAFLFGVLLYAVFHTPILG